MFAAGHSVRRRAMLVVRMVMLMRWQWTIATYVNQSRRPFVDTWCENKRNEIQLDVLRNKKSQVTFETNLDAIQLNQFPYSKT